MLQSRHCYFEICQLSGWPTRAVLSTWDMPTVFQNREGGAFQTRGHYFSRDLEIQRGMESVEKRSVSSSASCEARPSDARLLR